jgi:predicted NBD/HSP70 family sugar kinase
MSALVDFGSGEFRQKNNSARREELIAILSTIAVNYVAVLNPDVIVLSGKIFDKSLVEDIGRRMSYYLHAGIMPRITRDSGSATGLEGLIQSCRGYITTGVHLVQSTGLSQGADRIAV